MYHPRSRYGQHAVYHSMPSHRNTFVPIDKRQQPYPVMQLMNGQPAVDYPYMNPYPVQGSPYYFPPLQGSTGHQQQTISYQNPPNVFHNPLQEKDDSYPAQQIQPNGYPYMNPYPKGSFLTKPPSGMKSVLNSFKSQDGSLDINKMVDTAGQMMNAFNQVSSVVKGFGGMFKA